jgi:hypothetical protein
MLCDSGGIEKLFSKRACVVAVLGVIQHNFVQAAGGFFKGPEPKQAFAIRQVTAVTGVLNDDWFATCQVA